MKLKVFALRFAGSTEGFDDRPLQEFIADKEVIEFSEHFFVHENTPCLAILIAYRAPESLESRKTVRRSDPRHEFDGMEKEAYNALRTWRAAAAKMEGIPPYMIANNRQLAKMIKMKVATRESLGGVEGIGEAKIAAGPDTQPARPVFSKARGIRGSNRVIRGGSWNNDAHNCRSAMRNNNRPDNRNNNVGFRLSSSRQRSVAVCSRMHRPHQRPDHRPGPAPVSAGQTCHARRRSVGRKARTSPPGILRS